MIELVFYNKDIAVISKPVGIPSQSDPSGDRSAMELLAEALREKGEQANLWLVHRLDRVVGGLMVFARRREVAAELSAAISERRFEKAYLAVCHGKPSGSEMRDYIFKDSATGKSFAVKTPRVGAKEAVLSFSTLASVSDGSEELSLVRIRLETGRHHQIRVQFSSRKMPLVGDKKYGSRSRSARQPALFSAYLSFSCFGKQYEFQKYPDGALYPWSLFGTISRCDYDS